MANNHQAVVIHGLENQVTGAMIYWSDGALSVFWTDEQMWVLRGTDGKIHEERAGSQHYDDCMEVAGIRFRKKQVQSP